MSKIATTLIATAFAAASFGAFAQAAAPAAKASAPAAKASAPAKAASAAKKMEEKKK